MSASASSTWDGQGRFADGKFEDIGGFRLLDMLIEDAAGSMDDEDAMVRGIFRGSLGHPFYARLRPI